MITSARRERAPAVHAATGAALALLAPERDARWALTAWGGVGVTAYLPFGVFS